MFDFKHKGCNLDISNLCTLECPKCMRAQWKDKKQIPGSHMTVEQFTKIANYFPYIHLCGQISDPIFNPHFIEFLSICQVKNKKCTIHTAASQKPISWYEKAFNANKDTRWIFGLDGLPEESCLYRVNQDGEKLFEVIEKFKLHLLSSPDLQDKIKKLKGKVLGCYCSPLPCHGDVIINFLKGELK